MLTKHLYALLLGSLLFTACKKEDDASPANNSSKIIGNWKRSFTAADTNGNKMMDASEKVLASPGSYELLTFAPDGTCTDSFNNGGSGGKDLATYSVNGDWLTWTFTGTPSWVVKIYQLDDVALVIQDTSAPFIWLGYARQ